MITLLLPLVLKFLPYIVAALGALAALWKYGATKKAEGRDAAIQQVNDANAHAQSEIANDAEKNAGLDDAALDGKLSDPDPGHP